MSARLYEHPCKRTAPQQTLLITSSARRTAARIHDTIIAAWGLLYKRFKLKCHKETDNTVSSVHILWITTVFVV